MKRKVVSFLLAFIMIFQVSLYHVNAMSETTGDIQLNGFENQASDLETFEYVAPGDNTKTVAGTVKASMNSSQYVGQLIGADEEGSGGQNIYFYKEITPGTYDFEVTVNEGYKLDEFRVDGVAATLTLKDPSINNVYKISINVSADSTTSIQPTFAPSDGNDNPPISSDYTITTTCGPNGAIENSAPILSVQAHNNVFITIRPDYGYEIESIIIDKGLQTAHTLDETELEKVKYNNGIEFTNVTSDHSVEITFKAQSVAPKPFDNYQGLTDKINNKLFAYSNISDNEIAKGKLINDLWDILTHEFEGAFASKAALISAVSVNGSETLPKDSNVLDLPYYSYEVTLTNSTVISGKIYSLENDEIIIKYVKDQTTKYQKETLHYNQNAFPAPNYDDYSTVVDYDDYKSIDLGGAFIEGRTGLTDYSVSFHITAGDGGCQLSIYKPTFQGVIANHTGEDKVAAAWDFGNMPFVVFNNTTKDNPFVLKTYFGYTQITFNPQIEGTVINSISTSLPSNAVSTSGKTITFHSNYYDSVLVKVNYTFNGVDKVGYVLIQRLGIDIQEYTKQGNQTIGRTNHGTQPGVEFNWDNNDCVIYGTYYYPTSQTSQVDLYCTYTWSDGTVTTSLLNESTYIKTGEMDNLTSTDDFVLYKGSQANKPVKISVIAVQKDAFGDNTFKGAKFGSGAGVTWTKGEQ
ncbi:MAG: hypothetical protein PHH04_02170 [Thomasclavelia sp.]|jgi:hypothetical protein|nr:hypothetical protein [Thomasclavelia sp.]